MNWDVFICYAREDMEIVENISEILQENNLKTWMDDKNFKTINTVANIDNIINRSHVVCLVLSSYSSKSKDFNMYADMALRANKPLIIFNLNKTTTDRWKLLLNDHQVIYYHNNPDMAYQQLLNDTLKLLDESGRNMKFHETAYRNVQNIEKRSSDKNSNGQDMDNNTTSSYFKRILALITVISIIILVGIYVSSYMYIPELSDGYLSVDGAGVDIDKYPVANKLSLTPTTVNINDNHCIVYAKIYDNVTKLDDYIIKSDYYDSNGDLIDSVSCNIKDIEEEDGEYLLSDYTSDKIIAGVEITIFDQNNQQVYNMIIGDV